MRDLGGMTHAAGAKASHATSRYADLLKKYERQLVRWERKSAAWKEVLNHPAQPAGRQKALFGRLHGAETSGLPAPGKVNARTLRLRAQIDALRLADRVYRADPTTETRRRLDAYLNRGARIRDERDWVWNERKALQAARQEVQKLQGQPGFGSAQTQYTARYNAYLKRGGALRTLEGLHQTERKALQSYHPSDQESKLAAPQPVKPLPGAPQGPEFDPFTFNVRGHQPDWHKSSAHLSRRRRRRR